MSIIQYIPSTWYLFLSVILFVIGACGVLLRRNAIVILMSIELMLNAVNLLLVSSSAYIGDLSAQVFVFFVMIVAAAEVSVGLAILTLIYRFAKHIDIDRINLLKW